VQQLTLLCADLVNEAFLRQSAFSEVDRYCSPQRQTAMLKLILRFITLAETRLDDGIPPQRIAELDVLRRLQRMGEEIGESDLGKFAALGESVEAAMAGLGRAAIGHAS
jgi:V/A-type H+-transporting ATPase subunit A